MSAREDVPTNPRRRAVTALLPLMVTGTILVLAAGDRTGPHQGKVRLALAATALVGAAIVSVSMLKATKAHPKG